MSTDYGSRPGPHRIRASDEEREQIATILRAAMTEGRLSLEEGEQRLAAAYAATYRDELGPLTADLPDGGRQALHDTPEFQAYARRLFRRRGAFGFVVAGVLVGLWLLSGAHFFWPLIPLLFLFFCFSRHARHRHWHSAGGWHGGPGGRGPWHGRGAPPWETGWRRA
jgi:hypothetical protein